VTWRGRPFALALAGVAAWPGPASAHAFAQRYDLPLPLGFYLAGAALAVALSFLASFLIRRPLRESSLSIEFRVPERLGRICGHAVRVVAVLVLLLVIATGLFGPMSPTKNFATVFVWVLWWVGFTLFTALAIDLWRIGNPFRLAVDGICRVTGLGGRERRLPGAFGWVSVLGLLTVSWLELVSDLSEDPRALVALIGGYFAFVGIERRVLKSGNRPVLRTGLMAKRQVALVSIFAVGAGIVEAAFVFMTDYTTHALDLSDRAASFMLLPLVGAVSITSPLAGRLLDSVGSKRIVSIGLTFMAAGMAVLGWGPATTFSFVAGSVAIGVGLACLLGSALAYILLTEAEVSERTVAQGINTLFLSIGQILGSAGIGAIAASAVSAVAGYQTAFSWIAILCAALGLSTFLLDDRSKEQAQIN